MDPKQTDDQDESGDSGTQRCAPDYELLRKQMQSLGTAVESTNQLVGQVSAEMCRRLDEMTELIGAMNQILSGDRSAGRSALELATELKPKVEALEAWRASRTNGTVPP